MIRMALHLFGYDLRAFLRNRQSQFFTLASVAARRAFMLSKDSWSTGNCASTAGACRRVEPYQHSPAMPAASTPMAIHEPVCFLVTSEDCSETWDRSADGPLS